jgi:preprotein translocase subunit SecG
MSTFETVMMMLLVADAIALGALVLLQQGRGADVGAAFGSGSSNTMFGGGGSASFLTKLTVCLAIGFFLISFALAYAAKERAATMTSLGVPAVEAPASLGLDTGEGEGSAAGLEEQASEAEELPLTEELTTDSESVDSDIPDV